jgi:hypothetical protein
MLQKGHKLRSKEHMEKVNQARLLVDPYFRRQPEESDEDYRLFLIYRDLPWETRTQIAATAIATGVDISEVKEPHHMVRLTSAKWQWPVRVKAYDLWIQESNSDREERIRLQMKSDIEFICMRLTRKIRLIGEITKAEDLMDPEIQRDMAVVEALIGKGNGGKFVLDAYKTIVGQKVQLSALKKVPELEWKAA